LVDRSDYKIFDVVDFLTCEEDFAGYVVAMREEGGDSEDVERAYRDVERARVVHNIPAPEPAVAV